MITWGECVDSIIGGGSWARLSDKWIEVYIPVKSNCFSKTMRGS